MRPPSRGRVPHGGAASSYLRIPLPAEFPDATLRANSRRMFNPLSLILYFLFLPLSLLGCWRVVGPNEVIVLVYWGKIAGRLDTQGIHFVIPWGLNAVTISTRVTATEIHKTTVADLRGNPVVIAGVCTYRVVDPMKAAFAVSNYTTFISTQAVAALKQIAATYPYESEDGHSLRGETNKVAEEMVRRLQSRIEPAGVQVLSFDISDLTYAPEIAQAMLVRQQAEALVSARKVIVHGAVDIVEGAITHLAEKGLHIPEAERSRLVGNLLTVICGDAKVQPTYAINESRPGN